MSSDWRSNNFVYTPDLESYFSRIAYSGSREVCYETLKQIQWHHLLSIPFEDLDVYLKNEVDITPAAVERKLVFEKRGGYCFEHNTLLWHILLALGFDTVPILARSRWGKPLDTTSAFTHLVLKVTVDGVQYLFDVGFSNYGSPYPLAIDTTEEQPTPLEARRIIREGQFHVHQMKLQETWHDVFVFTLNRSFPMDWEVGNWYMSTHKSSFCLNSIVVSRPTETGRNLLLNKVLTFRALDGSVESREIATQSEYLTVLAEVFDIVLPVDTYLCPPNSTWD